MKRSPNDIETPKSAFNRGLLDIPKDVMVFILSFLSFSDVVNVSTLNSSMKQIVDNDNLWKLLIQRQYAQMNLAVPTKTTEATWKETHKMNLHYRELIETGSNMTLKKNIIESKEALQTAFGRFHYSGMHRYVIKIISVNYVGVGVGSTLLSSKEDCGREKLHYTVGCSAYYFSGVWYGCKGKRNIFANSDAFFSGDEITLYFDVDNGKVRYYQNDKLIASCKVHIRKEQIRKGQKQVKKGLRIAIVLGGSNAVSIVDYRPIDKFPSDKMITKPEYKTNTRFQD
eukprot:TRINITY_DN2805_c0_g1_i4.p1 TRINITY_DN2805_c0_g1~~TRINITY_DN2805_c0_g1_i4.p1  ORF type:complete len:284 (+),score=45.35 TRINITY_DN2805_c0_g1_i4:147-998(+)